jgi:hypothetical protein
LTIYDPLVSLNLSVTFVFTKKPVAQRNPVLLADKPIDRSYESKGTASRSNGLGPVAIVDALFHCISGWKSLLIGFGFRIHSILTALQHSVLQYLT